MRMAQLEPLRQPFPTPRWLKERRCMALLVALLALLVLYPCLSVPAFEGTALLDIVASAVLITAAYATARKPWQVTLSLVLVVPTLIARWLGIDESATHLGVLVAVCEIAFFALAISIVFEYVLRGRASTADRVAGALGVYLLIGVMFAEVFMLIEVVAPGSLASARPELAWQDLLYFSFVTLTTLGYGDIAPVSAQAEALVVTEAVLGVFYLAVLVAWLVSSLTPAVRPLSDHGE